MLAAAEVEEARVHPVAKAVFKWALSNAQQGILSAPSHAVSEIRNMERVLGKGVSCGVKAHADEWITVHVGHSDYFLENEISVAKDGKFANANASVVHFAFDRRYGGCIEVHDTLRHEASSVVTSLLQDGLEVSMVSLKFPKLWKINTINSLPANR